MKIEDIADEDLIIEMVKRGYTISFDGESRKMAERINKKMQSPPIRRSRRDTYENDLNKYPRPSRTSDLGPGMISNPLGNNPFASDEKIREQAHSGLEVLTSLVSSAIKPREKEKDNLDITKSVSLNKPKNKKVTLLDIDDVMDVPLKRK